MLPVDRMGYRDRMTGFTVPLTRFTAVTVGAALFALTVGTGLPAVSALVPMAPAQRIMSQTPRLQRSANFCRSTFNSQGQTMHSSNSLRSTASLLSLFRSSDNDNNFFARTRLPGLSRPHELILFILYGGTASSFLYSSVAKGPVIHSVAEAAVALAWVAMVLAISFMESWVKFKAPFLKKPAALDVGRHVFAALNAVELALSGSFWIGRVWCCRLSSAFVKSKEYYAQPNFILPAIATTVLLTQVTIVAPVLYLRAKAIIARSFSEGPLSAKESLSKVQREELAAITMEAHTSLQQVGMIPSNTWHKAYVVLELIKVGSLAAFVALKWLSISG